MNALRDRPEGAAVVARYAPNAALMNPFFQALQTERRTAPYPAEALDRAWPWAG